MATSRKPWSSREEYKKAKELEEARKAGTAPPEQDEEGRDINPHIPMYIAQAPWYLNTGKPGLKHQRKHNFREEKEQKYDGIEAWYARGRFSEAAVTSFRKGACQNCGAMTHGEKDCVDRPRKLAAKWTGKDIKPDEVIVEVNLDYEGKRDRWNGFDPRMYAQIMDRYQEADEARRKKLAEDQKKFMTEPDAAHKRYPHGTDENKTEVPAGKLVDVIDADLERAEFEDEEGKDSDRFTKRDPRTRTTVRNLRIREDRAKYLHNLDPDSAFYDPKSRSMRENPYEGKNPDEVTFAGDNFMRTSGDSQNFYEMQHYAWEACHDKPDIPNIFAEPSQAAVLFDSYKEKKRELENLVKKKLTQQYGGEAHTKVPPRMLLIGQTEVYQEYAPDGSLVLGSQSIPKSKYDEDVHLNNHTTVWGSYYDTKSGKWGYRCCGLVEKSLICLKTLAVAPEDTVALLKAKLKAIDEGGKEKKILLEEELRKKSKKSHKKHKERSSTDSSEEFESSSTSSEDKKKRKRSKSKKSSVESKKKIAKSKRKRTAHDDNDEDDVGGGDDTSRKIDIEREIHDQPTFAEMELYKRKQVRWDDPLKSID